MTPKRKKRLYWVVAVLGGVAVSVALAFRAFEDNMFYFYSPTQVLAGEVPVDKTIRVGGMVIPGSIEREDGSMTVHFLVTDTKETVKVEFTGILPDLFRDGQGVIARGQMQGQTVRRRRGAGQA